MFSILPCYPLFCPDCIIPTPNWRCINFWDAVWQCDVCNHIRLIDKHSVAYRGLPPAYVADFPYPQLEGNSNG